MNAKYRDIADKRGMRQEAGADFPLRLASDRPKDFDPSRSPGEIDAMTLHQAGFQALSVNAGAGNHSGSKAIGAS